jgi:cytochrome c
MLKYSAVSVFLFTTTALLGGCGKETAPTQAVNESTPSIVDKVETAPQTKSSGTDISNGQRQYAKCKACHTLSSGGANRIGPNLFGLDSRPAASLQGYGYSKALRGSGLVWNANTLDEWLKNPRKMVPGTRMSFVGIRDDKARRDLVLYLLKAGAGDPSLPN